MKQIAAIVAVDDKWGFGKDGKIPWHVPEDFKFFKSVTKGSVCIMGRRTYEDMCSYFPPDKFLPGRISIILTRDSNSLNAGTAIVASSIESALLAVDAYYPERNVFFIGGRHVYTESLNYVNTIFISQIKGDFECDVQFPYEKLLEKFYQLNSREGDSGNVKFVTYNRKTNDVT